MFRKAVPVVLPFRGRPQLVSLGRPTFWWLQFLRNQFLTCAFVCYLTIRFNANAYLSRGTEEGERERQRDGNGRTGNCDATEHPALPGHEGPSSDPESPFSFSDRRYCRRRHHHHHHQRRRRSHPTLIKLRSRRLLVYFPAVIRIPVPKGLPRPRHPQRHVPIKSDQPHAILVVW